MLITAPRVIPAAGRSQVLAPGYVIVRDGLVTGLGEGPAPEPPDIELSDGALLPGLVDLQVNGYFGVELSTAGPVGWGTVARRLPETGTTAFLPTFITAPLGDLATRLRAAATIVAELPDGGARVLGMHVEGPFLHPERRGAHNRAWIIQASPGAVRELITAGGR